MQKLIAKYLFQYKRCALPEIGTLEIKSTEAEVIAGEKRIVSGVPVISFSDQITDSADLQNYISLNNEISNAEAGDQLKTFCTSIRTLQNETQLEIPGAGNFYINSLGKLAFNRIIIPQSFRPDVQAVRAIHTNVSHPILVGDTETTNAAMEEYFKEEKPAEKSKWWIWAVLLFLIAAAAVIFYLNYKNRNAFFGSSKKTEIKPATSTYRKIP